MHTYNFPGRVKIRREGALARRKNNIKQWKEVIRLADGTENSELKIENAKKKIEIAEQDVANLSKKLGAAA